MTAHDVWYLAVETTIGGERRGFSRQVLAGEDRRRNIPTVVETACQTFLADCLAESDVHARPDGATYTDWPYRFASYHLTRNGATVVRSFAVSPVKPEYTED